MNTKKITASVVGVMLLATVLVMAVSAASMDRSKYADMPRMVYEYDADDGTGLYINENMDVPSNVTVRIYGEEGAIYPTQSYTGANNFIYPDPVDAFDPGVIGKDSATFNPAYLDDEYGLASAWWPDNIIVDGENGDEKVFLRVFYEPGYAHAADAVMSEYYSLTDVSMELGALVTETTYMLLENNIYEGDHSGLPKAGGIAGTERTRFMLPVAPSSVMDTTPGMDRGDMVDLAYAAHGSTITAGTIEVEESYDSTTTSVHIGDNVSFMDHSLILSGFNSAGAPIFTINYIGNMYAEHAEQTSHTVAKGEKFYFDRGNSPKATSDPAYRWYLEVTEVSYNQFTPNDNYVHISVGRRLAAGETFYVDGVRYDMPAIYVTDDDKFKYITLQSPIPKCDEGLWDPHNRPDTSHVRSQWLANLDEDLVVWVLPPFNDDHRMIDDIGIVKVPCGGVKRTIVNEAGNLLGVVPALEFYYVVEDTEDRFDTSLAERHARKDGVELWNWWSVFTKPYEYTELYLPDQETAGDGYEYLITTSFIAPNSEAEERAELCKSNREVHDIFDRAATISNADDDSRDAYANMPRMVFEYDADDDEDLFVNSDGAGECEVPTVRIYGEADAIYPTQSFTGADNFIYPNHVDAFDPGVIAKDSVTFNPAYLDDEYGLASAWWTDNIIVDGENGDEKVFLRVFYEPGYAHVADSVMSDYYSLTGVSMALGAVVTETTYMLLENNLYAGDHSGLPKAGGVAGTERTRFMLPVASSDVTDTTPGMDRGDMVDLAYAAHGSMLTAGTIEVEASYDSVTSAVHLGDDVSFMDHSLIMGGFNSTGAPMFTIGYVGNMNAEHAEQRSHTIAKGEKFYFDRGNSKQATSNPAYRWYLEVTEVSYNPYTPNANYAHITVGRRLAAGETFYVDGVRYDMPAIYVTDDDKFKYITLQSPIPKCYDGLWDPHNRPDTSHVRSQWLANLDEDLVVWVLPPFNADHTMIDDIGIQKVSCGGVTRIIDSEAGNILVGVVPALEFYYVAEATEDRFDTSLAERHAYDGSAEIWNWWSIFTKPYQYTELYLPDQETVGDGYEYLITTSFIAPNCEEDERTELCKSDREVHDIIDRAATLVDGGTTTPTKPCEIYDADASGTIVMAEAWAAIQDYLAETLTMSDAWDVVQCYLADQA